MSDKIVCGLGKLPKNGRRGTAKECLAKNQVRYWGKNAVPDNVMQSKDLMSPDKELIKLKQFEMQLKGLSTRLQRMKDMKKPDEQAIDKLKEKIKLVLAEYKTQKEKYEDAKKYMVENDDDDDEGEPEPEESKWMKILNAHKQELAKQKLINAKKEKAILALIEKYKK
jgi:hypothetical protein